MTTSSGMPNGLPYIAGRRRNRCPTTSAMQIHTTKKSKSPFHFEAASAPPERASSPNHTHAELPRDDTPSASTSPLGANVASPVGVA
jgi:hypothetical protein